MTPEEIIEGNKLIAEFMGYKISYQGNKPFVTIDKVLFDEYETIGNWAKYHSSWDWLMIVVEKIRQIFGDDFDKYIEKWEAIKWNLSNVDIKNTWLSVVEFIKWYNQNKRYEKDTQIYSTINGAK